MNSGRFRKVLGLGSCFPKNGSKVYNFGVEVKFGTKTPNFGLDVKFGIKTPILV